eukprot:scaffold2415_cov276-Ochromonas_danica.AAC.1
MASSGLFPPILAKRQGQKVKDGSQPMSRATGVVAGDTAEEATKNTKGGKEDGDISHAGKKPTIAVLAYGTTAQRVGGCECKQDPQEGQECEQYTCKSSKLFALFYGAFGVMPYNGSQAANSRSRASVSKQNSAAGFGGRRCLSFSSASFSLLRRRRRRRRRRRVAIVYYVSDVVNNRYSSF